MDPAGSTLLLFDIDGTLLSGATEAHSQSLREALRAVHRVDERRMRVNFAPAGRTDGEIARLLLLGAGVSAQRIDERADAVREECCRRYARLGTTDLQHTVLPGVVDLLAALSERDDVRLGLLTGNFEPVARMKLSQAGIGHYFAGGLGAFGSDSEDRTALPSIARRHAGARGRPHPRARTVIIGDTPRDIACARADDLRCVAVATGPHPAAELAGADEVVADAYGLAEVLAA